MIAKKLSLFQRIWRTLNTPIGFRAFAQGAITDRISADWRLTSASANQEARADIRELRRRARALFRDDPYVNGLVREYVQNVIGQTGITLMPKNDGKDGEPAEKPNKALSDAWEDWSHPENTSTDGVLSWVEMQGQIVESLVVDGEVFIRKHRAFKNDYGFALELIDPDQLNILQNKDADRNGNQIVMGVELDKWHRPVVYHFLERHPAEAGRKDTVPVPADEVIHLFKRKRIGQTRGVTFLAPIIFRLHMLGAYEDAEVTAARIGASKVGFFETDPQHLDSFEAPAPGEKITLDVAPGAMEQLPPGMKFVGWDPQHPNHGYKEFVGAVLRSIAVGVGVAYTTFTGDLSGVNYSSIRAGLLSERDMWKAMQTWLAEHLHRPVFNDWIEYAILTPKLSLPSRIAERWKDVTWKGRGWKWVDPYNEARSNEMQIALGVQSRQRLCAEMGVDFEETLKDLKRERELAEKYDVFIDGMAAKLDVPQPIPDPAQSGGSGTPEIPGTPPTAGAPSTINPAPPKKGRALTLYYDETKTGTE